MMRSLPDRDQLDTLESLWPVDPIADGLVGEIYSSHGLEATRAVLNACLTYRDIRLSDAATSGLPLAVWNDIQKFFEPEGAPHLPEWADGNKIERATTIYAEHRYTSCLVLGAASLPETYLCRDIAPILAATHRLDDDTHMRVIETLDFVIMMMTPGNLTGGEGAGIIAAKKVRLIHAVVRHLLQNAESSQVHVSQRAVSERLLGLNAGVRNPVHQVVMALTILSFGYVFVRSLLTLGAALSDKDQDAYVHTWSVVGHLMGVRDDLLPKNMEQACQLFQILKARQAADTEDTKHLYSSLLAYTKTMLPWYLQSLPRRFTLDLMTAEDCERLGLGRSTIASRVFGSATLCLAHILNKRYRSPLDGKVVVPHAYEYVARLLVTRFVELDTEKQRRIFELPDHLA